jgi:hypothetical protein
MSRRRKIIIGILAVVVVAVLAVAFWPEKPEPVYKGKKLSEWVIEARTNRVAADRAEFNEVFQAVGITGLPYYLEWIDYKTSLPKRLQLRFAAKVRQWFGFRWTPENKGAYRKLGAYAAIAKLGDAGAPAIPRLLSLATDPGGGDAPGAMEALAGIGQAAVPEYLALMTNADPKIRAWSVWSARESADLAIMAQIRRSAEDPALLVRQSATNAMVSAVIKFYRAEKNPKIQK